MQSCLDILDWHFVAVAFDFIVYPLCYWATNEIKVRTGNDQEQELV